MTTPTPPVAIFEIQKYMVIFRQLEERDFGGVTARIRAIVRCTGKGAKDGADYRLEVFFVAEDSLYPAPQVDLPNHSGAIFLPLSMLPSLVDVLRNEHPIYGHLRGDRPEWTSITTTDEPVGAGDESSNS